MIKYKNLLQFIKNIQDEFEVFGPVFDLGRDEVLIKKIEDPAVVDLTGRVTLYSFKKFFLQFSEELFYYSKEGHSKIKTKEKPLAVFGMNIWDLRALGMMDLIFKKDFYYQKRRQNNLVIGFSDVVIEGGNYDFFTEKFEENILEHLNFDIFIEKQGDKFEFFSGSTLGQKTLEKYGITEYEHVQFAGYIMEEGKDKRMLTLQEKVKNSADSEVWKELGERCYACGKCTSVCPTCYCFDFEDVVGPEGSKKVRKLTSCFHPEFSQIAGNHKFLDSISKRIYYWYYHKFVMIPEKYSVPGCVSCLRCSKTCPAGIDIRKVLASL
jgi:ferredoxin